MAGGAETPNIAALPAIARLGACESARGPDADRHVKLLIQFAVEGACFGADLHQGSHCPRCVWPYVFRGQGVDNAFVSFPNYWKHLFEDTPLCGAVPLGGWPRMFAFLKHWRDRRGQALADADALMAKYWS